MVMNRDITVLGADDKAGLLARRGREARQGHKALRKAMLLLNEAVGNAVS